MATGHLIQTAIEFVLLCGVIVGLFNESKISDWEKKTFAKAKSKIKSLKMGR